MLCKHKTTDFRGGRNKNMKLICLPYAGGSSQALKNKLGKFLDSSIEIVLIELPGRGSRFGEKLISEFNELIEDLMQKVLLEISDGMDYALLGYSMGSRIIYVLYYEIVKRKVKKPKTMFFCSAIPPKIPYVRKKLDRESIIQEMKRLGGTDSEVLSNAQLMDIFTTVMRADMYALYSYVHIENKEKIQVPIVVQYGSYDGDVIDSVKKWADYAEDSCEFYEYDDGHFFINRYNKEMAEVINAKLRRNNLDKC